MTELKCPVCKKELRPLAIGWCCDCGMCGDKELWQALIDTKKKLDRAIWWLNEIVENHRFTPISTAEKAIEEINQKEEQ